MIKPGTSEECQGNLLHPLNELSQIKGVVVPAQILLILYHMKSKTPYLPESVLIKILSMCTL